MNRIGQQRFLWRESDRLNPPKRVPQERVRDFCEIDSLSDAETIRMQAARCVQCAEPACVAACPLHNRIPEWLALAADGCFLEAAELSRETSAMPEICPRVCPQEKLCEGNCVLTARAEPVCIGAIEKFLQEYALEHGAGRVECAPPNGRRVAVVGSGPGGLACADLLSQWGYAVTVWESQPEAGGLLLFGIPAFKLDKAVVERRIGLLRSQGVAFRTGVTIGRDLSLETLRAEFDAVYLGIGALTPKLAGIPGSDLCGVHQGLPFLARKNAGLSLDQPDVPVTGRRVVVLGGGDSAMDCLRTALRCGAAEAVCVYRRDLANMPGSRKEYQHALEEGARFLFLTNPTEILGDDQGGVAGVRCQRMELGGADASGRRKPQAVTGSDFTVAAELVLVAYGFDPAPYGPASDLAGVKVNSWGAAEVDESQQTNLARVYAGGDVVRGPSLVVHAIRDGRRAAEAMHRHFEQAGVVVGKSPARRLQAHGA
jgi:glutamate synthase (NADPH) small chain